MQRVVGFSGSRMDSNNAMKIAKTTNLVEKPEAPPERETTLKYVSFSNDVYGSDLFPPVVSYDDYSTSFEETGLETSMCATQRPFFPSVPTEETSMVGRERRDRFTKRKKGQEENSTFNYLSAVYDGHFCDEDYGPFFHDLPSITTVLSKSCEEGFVGGENRSDVARVFQHLLTQSPSKCEESINSGKIKEDDICEETSNKETQKSIREGILNRSDDVTECIAMLAPKIQRKRNANSTKRKTSFNECRSSQFRGVTKHRRSGRWEAHIWIKEMGRQVYLGGYEKEEHAAEAYDVAALKSKGDKVKTNFDISKYEDLKDVLKSITMDELVMIVRRQSQGFSRGTSVFRGVTHHPSGRWEARIGIPGSKHIYLGLYNDEFEAAKWYDRALVRLRGPTAATNFLLSNYHDELMEHYELQQAVQGDPARIGMKKFGQRFDAWVKCGRAGLDGTAKIKTTEKERLAHSVDVFVSDSKALEIKEDIAESVSSHCIKQNSINDPCQ